ncbi:MAG: DUF2240 family protein [Candidatus Aenigmarchaeota archaeon]|nr:DUF2240 family protein [Candidatus Aenigmarchaeota archaeon]
MVNKTEDKNISLIDDIAKKSGMKKDDILKKIEDKEKEFEGLVSREGAIYIIGKELGIEVQKPKAESLTIKNVVSNMRQINLIAKVIFISPMKEFNKGGKIGKVLNMTLGDDTGTITMSIWNEDTDNIKDIAAGDVIMLKNSYSKDGYLGKTELVFNSRSSIEKSDETIDIDVQETPKNQQAGNNARQIESLKSTKEFDRVTTKGCLAEVYEKKIVHNLCPQCRKKTGENSTCAQHGKVKPEKFLIISGIVDDGYGRMDAVFFNSAVENLMQKNSAEIEKEIKDRTTNQFLRDNNILAKDHIIEGIVKKNRITGTDELHVQVVKQLNIETEIKAMIKDAKV